MASAVRRKVAQVEIRVEIGNDRRRYLIPRLELRHPLAGQPLRLGDLGGGQGLSQRSGLLLILWYWQKVSPR